MNIRSIAGAALLVVGLGNMPIAAQAETISLSAELSGANEVPPNDSGASGTAEAQYDTETHMLTFLVEYAGMTGPAIGAHIHGPIGAGANAGIMIPFTKLDSPIQGSIKVTATQAESILAGLTYVNIHTEHHPGGELRGQLMK